MASKKKTGVEWVGGIVLLPTYVTGEGAPYRPESLLWLNADGAVMGAATTRPGELMAVAGANLKETIARPMFGKARAPTRIRVASQALADVLRAAHPQLEIVSAPTPEVDAVVAAMTTHLDEHGATEQTYIAPDIGPEMMASFFRAAAALFRARPWAVIPGSRSVLSLTIEKFGVRDAALVVIGQLGENFGFILFSSVADHETFIDAAHAFQRDEEARIPPHFALNFERRADLEPTLRKEVMKHHWEIAGPDAYPWLVAVDEELIARPPTADEVIMSEAICLAIGALITQQEALTAALSGEGPPVASVLMAHTHAGDVEVALIAPHAQAVGRANVDLMADLFDLVDGDGLDPRDRAPLEAELIARFEDSPEAKVLNEIGVCELVMDFAADHFSATIATLDAHELREIVFDIVPRRVSVEASEAGGIIAELHAFYSFMKREFGLVQANACLRVLDNEAVTRLRAALSDNGNFGMAKSLLMGGAAAGFDMGTQKGIEGWMQQVSSSPLPDSFKLPFGGGPVRPVAKVDASAKKKQRKATQKARRKNR